MEYFMVMVVRITSIIKITDAGIRISYFDGSIRVNRNDPNPINKVAIVPAIDIVLLALLSNIDLISISLSIGEILSSFQKNCVVCSTALWSRAYDISLTGCILWQYSGMCMTWIATS